MLNGGDSWCIVGENLTHGDRIMKRNERFCLSLISRLYEVVVGQAPTDDDLDRVVCEHEGKIGHQQCGWCSDCKCPRFMCGHLAQSKD